MTFKPSKYQEAVYAAIEAGDGNIIIEAVAGSGKTSTMLEATHRLVNADVAPDQILFLAFNKNIATELSNKVADGVSARTFNSLGHGTLFRAIQANINLDTKKNWNILYTLQDEGRVFDYEIEMYGAAIQMVKLAKQAGIGILVPNTESAWLDIVYHFDIEFQARGREIDESRAVEIAQQVLSIGVEQAKEGKIDFDDQLYLPILWNLHFRSFEFIFVDECQDVNAIQRAILRKVLGKNGRLIAVGDTKQAIYGFRGADTEAMYLIQQEFNARPLPLSICYRCATRIVDLAKTVVPQIEAFDDNVNGTVNTLDKYNKGSFTKGDAIICRNNKPLVKLAYELIARGIGAKIRGRDIGKGLKALVEKMNAKNAEQLVDRLEIYKQKEMDRHIQKGHEDKAQVVEDKVDTLLIIISTLAIDDFTRLGTAIDKLFTDGGANVLLSSIHKAKGLEWDRVFFLDSGLIPSPWAKKDWQIDQEDNLYYVGVTRAKTTLTFIESDHWHYAEF